MSIKLTYKNQYGTVEMNGGGEHPIRITDIRGLGAVEREYTAVSYAGCDGQETVSSRALPRSITVSGDICAESAEDELRRIIGVLCREGYLTVADGGMCCRIYCNQTVFPDAERILRGRITSFAVQFVCDDPYFGDAEEISQPLYTRKKNLKTVFTLPRPFGMVTNGETVTNLGLREAEPIIRIYTPQSSTGEESIIITNETTSKYIKLTMQCTEGDTITIDVKRRTAVSEKLGSLEDKLSDDTFLGDFVLIGGKNRITVQIGDASRDAVCECVWTNRYDSAAVV